MEEEGWQCVPVHREGAIHQIGQRKGQGGVALNPSPLSETASRIAGSAGGEERNENMRERGRERE